MVDNHTPPSLRATPSSLEGESVSSNSKAERLADSPSSLEGESVSNNPKAERLADSPSKLEGVPDRAGAYGKTGAYDVRHFKVNAPRVKQLRRRLRKNGTPAEAALWNIIKNKEVCDLQFRRQYSVGNYILDFYCPKLRLAIELDGDYHNQSLADEHDFVRDKELCEIYKISTLRFENKIVFEQPEAIIDSIKAEYIRTMN